VTAIRAVAWRFMTLVARRRPAAWVGERGRRFEGADPDMLMVDLSAASGVALAIGAASFAWWVITGRGPRPHLAGVRWF
jgi:hypothetical protein